MNEALTSLRAVAFLGDQTRIDIRPVNNYPGSHVMYLGESGENITLHGTPYQLQRIQAALHAQFGEVAAS